MKPLRLLAYCLCFFFIISCQKEIDWGTPASGGTGSGGTGSGGTGGSGSGSNGDLLVKAVAITAGTTDTNTLNLTWNAAKQLTQYKSAGRTNGFDATAQYDIIRLSNGNIQKIFSKPFGFFPGMGGVDSVVTYVYYQTGSNKVQYALSKTYTSFLNTNDSIVFSYNSGGKIITKTTYQESLITGTMAMSAKESYTYDANGNVTTVTADTVDPITGVLIPGGSTTMTYNTHKSPLTMGDEAFLILAPENSSVNSYSTKVQSGTAGGGGVSGTITGTLSNTIYNSYDRPTKGTITTTPMPPGYVTNYTYYYQ
jgi:hypothetical protein